MKKGFTLVEILVAIMIVVVLVTMAAPMYDKAIEKSRIAEARVTAKKLWDAKARMMDTLGLEKYNGEFGFENLDFSMACPGGQSSNAKGHYVICRTKDFAFSLQPQGSSDMFRRGIGVYRLGNDESYAGTTFLYLGDDPELDAQRSNFLCHANPMGMGTTGVSCDAYGVMADSSSWATQPSL